jgi:prepilin-type N-terminal cleavage/methylation domain-containing protein
MVSHFILDDMTHDRASTNWRFQLMKHKTKRKGFTLIELLVVMSIIALLLSILMPALGRARAEAMLTKDQTQVKSIFSGFTMWAPSHNASYPVPGLERRHPSNAGLIKGRGPEDLSQNDHAKMLSMSVMQNLFSTDVLYAPTEQGDNCFPMEAYNYNIYDVSDWIFWDENLKNNLKDQDEGCNNSYGIMPVTGKRKQQSWNTSTHNPTSYAVIGTRGPTNDVSIDDEWEAHLADSKTNLFHGIDRDWKGTVTFNDGHNKVLETFYPISSTYINTFGDAVPDNIFLEEPDQAIDNDYMSGDPFSKGQGADIILTHVIETEGNLDGTDGKGGKCVEFLHD